MSVYKKPHIARMYCPFMPRMTENGTEYGAKCWGIWENHAACIRGDAPITKTYHWAYVNILVRDTYARR